MTIFHNHKVVSDNLPWLNDTGRNKFYKDAIGLSVQGKRVLEAGPGAGVLMQYALDGGADHVTGIEIRKDRAKFLEKLFSFQGHKNFTIINADFMSMQEKFIKGFDVVICEQTGDQFKNDCQLLKLFNKLQDHEVISIPDSWTIDVHVYDGFVKSSVPLVLNDMIPQNYATAVREMSYPQPTEVLQDIWRTSLGEADKDLCFDLDLTGYKDCTLLIDDHVSFKGKRCPYLTGYQNWNKPYTLHIHDAKGHYRIYYSEGLWKHERK